MQSAVIEYSRNVLGLKDANSTEMNPKTSAPVIDLIYAQKEVTEKGGTMRLGGQQCFLSSDSLTKTLYGNNIIKERHRHRYEVIAV
jgi:CTP synthase